VRSGPHGTFRLILVGALSLMAPMARLDASASERHPTINASMGDPRLTAPDSIANDPASPPPSVSPSSSAPDTAYRWVELPPPTRNEHVAILDQKRGQMVVFGGRAGPGSRSDVWVLELGTHASWHRVIPHGTAPSPRVGACAALDPIHDRIIVCGGRDASGLLNDLWELTLSPPMSWRRLSPRGVAPHSRSHATLTFDPLGERMFLFGGWGDEFDLDRNDLWELSLRGPLKWVAHELPGAPSARGAHAAVYVSSLRGVLVFGGTRCPSCPAQSDLWLLSTLDTLRWVDLAPRLHDSGPCGIEGHAATYDSLADRVLIIGGGGALFDPCPQAPFVEVWSLSVRDFQWKRESVGGEHPLDRRFESALIDSRHDRVIVYGGGDRYGYQTFADTWSLSFGDPMIWSRLYPPAPWPNWQSFHQAIYDSVGDRILAFEGTDTWEYPFGHDSGWQRVATHGAVPPSRFAATLAYDSKRRQMIVHGGVRYPINVNDYSLRDTWTLSLDDPPTWSQLLTHGDPPGAGWMPAVYDPFNDCLLLLTTDVTPDRWAVSVSALGLLGDLTWREFASPDTARDFPEIRVGASMVLDARVGRLLVFGGGFEALLFDWFDWNDTWQVESLDSLRWIHLKAGGESSDLPSPRSFHSAFIDPIRNRMLIIAGAQGRSIAEFNDVWYLDLTSNQWSRSDPSGGPTPQWFNHAAVYDSRRDRIVMFENAYLWALELSPTGRARAESRDLASSPASIEEPSPELGLRTQSPALGRSVTHAEVILPDAAPASLQLFDLAGRRIWSREVGSLGRGAHPIDVAAGEHLAAGIYLLRLTHGASTLSAKVVRLE
jgi:hypothetical protein